MINLTVGQLIAKLSRYPVNIPVRIGITDLETDYQCLTTGWDNEPVYMHKHTDGTCELWLNGHEPKN